MWRIITLKKIEAEDDLTISCVLYKMPITISVRQLYPPRTSYNNNNIVTFSQI